MSNSDNHSSEMHSSQALFHSAAWSTVGQILPLGVAMITIPRLLHALGDERFGLLTLSWLLVGYFTILDLGLGRALILVFSRLRLGIDKQAISSIFWTGSAILVSIGFLIAILVQFLAPWICTLLSVAPHLRTEAIGAVQIAGWTMPTILMLHVLMGLPTAYQKQRGLSLLRIPTGILSHLVPLTMVLWTVDLRNLLWANLVLRLVLLAVHFWYSCHVQPVNWPPHVESTTAKHLLSISSWMMLTNILAPLLMNVDRVLISHRVGTGALACYAPAMDMATKVLILVGGSLSVLFPALGHHLKNDPAHAVEVYNGSLRSVAWWMAPFIILGVGLARPTMILWLGRSHGESAGTFFAIFLIGVLCSLPGQVSFAAVQAAGEARKASFLHAVELPIFLGLLWLFLKDANLVGVAWVWSARHLVDSTVLHLIARSHGLKSDDDRSFVLPMLAGLALAIPIVLLHSRSEWMGVASAGAICLVWCATGWFTAVGQAAIPTFARRFLPAAPR